MTRRRVASLAAVLCLALPLHAQESPSVPAAIALQLRSGLELTDAQVVKLQELIKKQERLLSNATTAYLRAEADVMDASRSEDLVIRRAALEKRAKTAIDAEMIRLKAEKDVRAILTAKQVALYPEMFAVNGDGQRRALWRPVVAPNNLTIPAEATVDSGEVRISLSPNYAGIYLGGELRGTGRRLMILPVGKHELKFSAAGCTEVVVPIEVTKGPPVIISQALTCK